MSDVSVKTVLGCALPREMTIALHTMNGARAVQNSAEEDPCRQSKRGCEEEQKQ
jgi:hypothetical protein